LVVVLETPQTDLEPLVDLIAERNFLKNEVNRLRDDLIHWEEREKQLP